MKIRIFFVLMAFILVSCSIDPNNSIVNNNSSSSSSSSSGSIHYIPENSKGEYIADDWFLPYKKPEYRLNYGGKWKDILEKEWAFYKKEMIDEHGIDLVVNNKKEQDGFYAAFSEGVAYGLIFSLYMNDQSTFNKIWDAAEEKMRLPSGYFGWRYDVTDGEFHLPGDKTSASDAEMEITYALLCAAKLSEKGYWDNHTSPNNQDYETRAKEILNLVYNPDNSDGKTQIRWNLVMPGDLAMWGWKDLDNTDNIGYNPSYFMPAYIKEFNNYKETSGWEKTIDNCYNVMKKFDGYNKGMAPDWCNADGKQITSLSRALVGQKQQYYMYLDGIRVPFRIGTDAVWNRDERAIEYCNNVASYINRWEMAGYYAMDGTLATLDNSEATLSKTMYEVSWMAATFFEYGDADKEKTMSTAGFPALSMWLGAIMGSDNEDLKVEFAEKLKNTWQESAKYDTKKDGEMPRFGVTTTAFSAGNQYFMQSLAMFGALMASGCYTNILEDLK